MSRITTLPFLFFGWLWPVSVWTMDMEGTDQYSLNDMSTELQIRISRQLPLPNKVALLLTSKAQGYLLEDISKELVRLCFPNATKREDESWQEVFNAHLTDLTEHNLRFLELHGRFPHHDKGHCLMRKKMQRKASKSVSKMPKNMQRILTRFKLSKCKMTHGNFWGADFSEVVFDNVTLKRSNLTYATMAGGTFTDCSFKRARLRNVDAHAANFRGTSFFKADLTDINLSGARIDSAIFLRAYYVVNGEKKDVTLEWLKAQKARWKKKKQPQV